MWSDGLSILAPGNLICAVSPPSQVLSKSPVLEQQPGTRPGLHGPLADEVDDARSGGVCASSLG